MTGAPAGEESASPIVRVAVSSRADERLAEVRLRSLLALELRGVAEVMREPTGPLGEDVIRVWIDAPSPRRAVIEVRRTDRSLARRALRIADYPADVAARLVAIATSEMVRVQARSLARRAAPPAEPRPGTESGDGSSFRIDASGVALVLPTSEPMVLAGPELGLEHRRGITAQILYGRWLFGESDGMRARWLEVGGAFDVRLALSEAWRVRLALKAGGVALALPTAASVDQLPSDGSEWTVRAGGLVGIEVAVTPEVWLGLGVEPGASLRQLTVVDRGGQERELGGFALGLLLSLSAAPFQDAPPAAAAQEQRSDVNRRAVR